MTVCQNMIIMWLLFLLLKGSSRDLLSHFQKVGGHFKKEIETVEAEISQLLAHTMSQAPKMLYPPPPIMQLGSVFH